MLIPSHSYAHSIYHLRVVTSSIFETRMSQAAPLTPSNKTLLCFCFLPRIIHICVCNPVQRFIFILPEWPNPMKLWGLAPVEEGLRSESSLCTCYPVVFYLFIGLVGCSIEPGISCGACKLTRTPWLYKKKTFCVLFFTQNYTYVCV